MITKKTRNHPTYCSRRDYHLSSGFTLIEVLIVVAILGILAAIGYPTLTKWVPNYQLKAATQELYANLQKAKMHAVKSNKDVTFNFTVSADCSGVSGYTFTDQGGKKVSSVNMKSGGACISSTNFTNFTSGFDPRGLPANALGGTVTLKHAKITRNFDIKQSSAGNIRTE